MPYVGKQARAELNVRTDRDVHTAGELNFAITRLVDQFLGATPRYQDFNDAIGALEGAKLELYAKVVRPYEDKKEAENGTVYRTR